MRIALTFKSAVIKKRSSSNAEWLDPDEPELRVTKMRDGRTLLAHKAEWAVDKCPAAASS